MVRGARGVEGGSGSLGDPGESRRTRGSERTREEGGSCRVAGTEVIGVRDGYILYGQIFCRNNSTKILIICLDVNKLHVSSSSNYTSIGNSGSGVSSIIYMDNGGV